MRYASGWGAMLMVLLVALPAGAAESGCQAEAAAAVADWRAAWPTWPAVKPGNAMVSDHFGHRHALADYEAMLRRLRAGRAACDQGDQATAAAELRLVEHWLGEDTGPAGPARVARGG